MRRLRKKTVIIVLAIALSFSLMIAGVVTYAEFTDSKHAQRTIATYESTGDKFSSNLLTKNDNPITERDVYTTDAAVSASTAFTLCNYEQGKQLYPYGERFSYTLSAKLVKWTGSAYEDATESDVSASKTVTITTSGEDPVELSKSSLYYDASEHDLDNRFKHEFTANVAGIKTYSISFSTAFIDNDNDIYVQVDATPSIDSLPYLHAIFKPVLRAAGVTNSWSGHFSDSTSYTPASYDGFNYRIEGSGSGTFTLTWNSAKVELSYVSSIMLKSIDGATHTSNSITFPVDSDVTGLYDIQFYKKQPADSSWSWESTDWSAMSGSIVTYSFS